MCVDDPLPITHVLHVLCCTYYIQPFTQSIYLSLLRDRVLDVLLGTLSLILPIRGRGEGLLYFLGGERLILLGMGDLLDGDDLLDGEDRLGDGRLGDNRLGDGRLGDGLHLPRDRGEGGDTEGRCCSSAIFLSRD